MKSTRWILFGLAIAAFALEASVCPYLTWRGIQPNLTLIFAVAVGLAFGPREGALLGFWAGFLQDVSFGRYLGVYGSAHLIAGYMAGQSAVRMFRDNLGLALAVTVAATIVAEGMALIMFRLLGVPLPLLSGLVDVIIPGAVMNGLLAPLVYMPILRLCRRAEALDERQSAGD